MKKDFRKGETLSFHRDSVSPDIYKKTQKSLIFLQWILFAKRIGIYFVVWNHECPPLVTSRNVSVTLAEDMVIHIVV